MNNLILIEDNDLSRTYELTSGEHVIITLDEDYREILVESYDGEYIGKIELDCDHDYDPTCKIVWMYLDGQNGRYLHKGIGREALKFLKEYSGCQIITEDDNGIKRDDGSHLTGDAPVFVNKMRKEGIIAKSIDDISGPD